MHRILICPNAYKGSLTAAAAAEAIRAGLEEAAAALRASRRCELQLETDLLPLADGGDGTLATLVAATGGKIVTRQVQGPLGEPVEASWGRLGGARSDTAVIEMALASGLTLLNPHARDPRRTSTFGTGELMRAALEAGCRSLIVGIGGSATNDGGAGMAAALGVRLLDSTGRELEPGGAALRRLAHIDTSGLHLPPDASVLVASDVDNPLCGPQGASAIYGPQKGASPETVIELDAALAHYAEILRSQLGVDVANIPGSGAAGGLGAGLMAFCGGRIRSGLELVMEVTDFEARLRASDLAITGEGQLDGQTARGKVVAGVAKRAREAGVPAIAIAGALDESAEWALYEMGLTAAFSLVDRPMSLDAAMEGAASLLKASAGRILRIAAADILGET